MGTWPLLLQELLTAHPLNGKMMFPHFSSDFSVSSFHEALAVLHKHEESYSTSAEMMQDTASSFEQHGVLPGPWNPQPAAVNDREHFVRQLEPSSSGRSLRPFVKLSSRAIVPDGAFGTGNGDEEKENEVPTTTGGVAEKRKQAAAKAVLADGEGSGARPPAKRKVTGERRPGAGNAIEYGSFDVHY
jgi:hypothetical protein